MRWPATVPRLKLAAQYPDEYIRKSNHAAVKSTAPGASPLELPIYPLFLRWHSLAIFAAIQNNIVNNMVIQFRNLIDSPN